MTAETTKVENESKATLSSEDLGRVAEAARFIGKSVNILAALAERGEQGAYDIAYAIKKEPGNVNAMLLSLCACGVLGFGEVQAKGPRGVKRVFFLTDYGDALWKATLAISAACPVGSGTNVPS